MANGVIIPTNNGNVYNLTAAQTGVTSLVGNCTVIGNTVIINMYWEGNRNGSETIAFPPPEYYPKQAVNGSGTAVLNGVTYPCPYTISTEGRIKQGLTGQSCSSGNAVFTYTI